MGREVIYDELRLHRGFTDHEKIAWLAKDLNIERRKTKKLIAENKVLREKNSVLIKQINDDTVQYPSSIEGKTTVTVKAYCKLRELNQNLEAQLLEMGIELAKYKTEEKF